MRLIIEQSDFRSLSPQTQRELLDYYAGKKAPSKRRRAVASARWARPMDLSLTFTRSLIQGLTETQSERLRLFGSEDGRVGMRDLLALTGDSDWRALSQWQGVLTRRLRRLLGDGEKKAHLIGWDYEATTWDDSHSNIVDGVSFVTRKTAQSLRRYFNES
jgi:hypothetical protein